MEYDGTRYAGFQRQKREITIQEEIEKALASVTQEQTKIVGAGRTDAGVHATGQVISFSTGWKRSLSELQRALNALLPSDIAILELSEVPPDFHARKSALSRKYRYTIFNRSVRSPLSRLYAYHWVGGLDLEAMEEALGSLIGVHDFASFGRAQPGGSTMRQMLEVDCHREGNYIYIDLEANAFLKRMVRSIAGTLLLVGRGELSPQGFKEVLEAKDRSRAGDLLPAHGLCLTKVSYPRRYAI
ncbi:MAG: tRNA pseudouridine(38-40) synthase TruA [Anaerolineae bacterium]